MKRYQVKIDDDVSSKAFTLDELLEMGLLDDYDEHILLRAYGESVWQIAREYPFYITEAETSTVNNNGIVSPKNSQSAYTIDEYGQVIRRGDTKKIFDLSITSLNFTSESSSRTINVTSNGIWSISLGAASWVHLTTSGDLLIVRVEKNNNQYSRTDYFKLKSGNEEKIVNIHQSGVCSSSSSSSSNNDGKNGCIWAIVICIALIILASII